MSSEFQSQISLIEREILNLVQKFIDRLSLVQEALIELHPSIIVNKRQFSDPKEREHYIRLFWETTKGVGLWREKWNFRIHGMGCELIHIKTGEPLEWDLSDKNTFDKNWFVNWLNWLLCDTSTENPIKRLIGDLCDHSIQENREIIFPILESLAKQGLLRVKGSYQYIIMIEKGED